MGVMAVMAIDKPLNSARLQAECVGGMCGREYAGGNMLAGMYRRNMLAE